MMDTDRRIVLVVAVIGVLIAGSVYFFVKTSQKKVAEVGFNYNGFQFLKVPTGYRVQIYINQNKEPSYFTVRSDPRELERIPTDQRIMELKDKRQVYVVIDPYENLTGVTTMAALELEKIIENPYLFNIQLNSAFIREYPGKEFPIKTCEDVNETVGVIWLKLGEETRVSVVDGCVVMEALLEDDLVKAANRVTLTLLGVMKVAG